jgi:hypothetical protein
MHHEPMSDIRVTASPTSMGWTCEVSVSDRGSTSRHRVLVSKADLARLAPADEGPEELVRRSFEFLLQREPKESILATFELPLIGRYFPEYERSVGRAARG